MFKIKEYVPASSIWETAEDYVDEGLVVGLVRGYNIEVETSDSIVDWLSANWIHEDPEVFFNSDFYLWYCEEHGWTPTGRICFRGYGEEEYDLDEHEFYVTNVGPRGNR